MFGEHDYDKALAIAEAKSLELNTRCIVVAGIEDPKKFTVAVPISAISSKEFLARLRNAQH